MYTETMSGIDNDITAAIGGTPLVRLHRLGSESTTLLAKLESCNPCGSVKDRIAAAMIESAEAEGKLHPGGLVIEPTSGNTGVSLAFVCAAKGYKLWLTMPESTSLERQKVLRHLGANIALTPASRGLAGAIDKAEQLLFSHRGSFMPNQFVNPANPQIHRLTTAEEIWRDTRGELDIFVSAVGTGGTLTGCSEVFKSRNPSIQIVAVEPKDSPVLSGGRPGLHEIQGIGAGFVPKVLNVDLIDEVIAVATQEALETSRQLACREGILAGTSSGAALWAAVQLSLRPQNLGKTIVVVLPDNAERYLSTSLFLPMRGR